MTFAISQDFIAEANREDEAALAEDYAALGRQLERRGIDIEKMTQRAMDYAVAVPSWGVGTGGTRFARFPGPGEPRNIFEKIDDCGVIHQLTRTTPAVSPHIPWDKVDDYSALRQKAASHELSFDAVNSNTFQDAKGQKLSYKFGSLTHADAATRAQAVEHNLECIEIGRKLGSTALTVWIADGSNFPGQSNLNAAFDRYMNSLRAIYDALPKDWSVFLLFDRHFRLGLKLHGRNRARPQGEMPGRSRPPRAQHQYRADRRPSHPSPKARRLPFQRFEIWRRRSRFRFRRSLPAVPRLQ
jgi:L-rhamnose isomerase/sugar isomerase